MAKKTLEKRRLARAEAMTVAPSDHETTPANDAYDEDEVIDPDEDDYIPKPAPKPTATVVSFHDTTDGEQETEEPKSFAEKLAAATFNQGKVFYLIIDFYSMFTKT